MTKLISILTMCLISWNTFGQISGTVFRDFNFSGTRTTANPAEPLVAGIIVNAYDNSNQIIASYITTNGSGTQASYPYTGTNFSIPATGTYNGTQGSNTGGVPSGTQVRLEFVSGTSACASSTFDPSSHNGSENATSVQFITAPSTTVSYAINNPADYNTGTNGVSLFIPIHASGTVPQSLHNYFVGYPYTNSGNGAPAQVIDGGTIGGLWGVAYSKQAKKIFSSAVIKRHVGLGVMGPGGIYMLEPTASSFNVTQFFDMNSNTFNTAATPTTRVSANGVAGAPGYGSGTSYADVGPNYTSVNYLGTNDPLTGKPYGLGVVGNNFQRGTWDPAAFDQVGKVGMGDIDISDDGKFLFVMNLYQRKIFRLELNDAYNPTSVVAVTSYALPSVTVTNGELRPWATKFYKGKLYVGAVASGENETTNTNANLRGYVFELNNATSAGSFNPSAVLDFPLNYGKGGVAGNSGGGKWYPWVNDAARQLTVGSSATVFPTPILSDIEINERKDLITAFTDRTGHQLYTGMPLMLSPFGGSALANPVIGGDILIAGKNCPTEYTLENNGSINSNGVTYTTSNPNNNQGPGTAEFFNGDNYVNSHGETSQGAMAILMGSNEVTLSVMGGISLNSGGTKKLSTRDGSLVPSSAYRLYQQLSGYEYKGNGLGDLELLTSESPLEIGNRIWLDANNNGIQDANETTAGVASGTTVTLHSPGVDGIYGNGDDQTWTTTTDANGNYYFSALSSNDNRRTAGMVASGNMVNQLLPGFDYRIEVGIPSGLSASVADVGANSNDTRDNDATVIGGQAVINVNTLNTLHDLDIGLSAPGYGSIGNYVWTDLNGNGLNDEPSTAAISGVTVYLLNASNAIIDSTTTDLTGAYLFDSLASGTYYIQFPTSNSGNGLTTQTTTAQTDNNSDANTGTGISPAVVINTAGTGQDKDNTTIDAGYAPLGSIGNYVWTDLNGNGLNDEPLTAAISGVKVYLLNASNTIIDSTTTDLTGAYLFDSLASGTYYVQFPTSNSGNGLTTQTTTAQTDNNSDANTATGISPAVVINTAGTGQDLDNTTIDAGYAPLGSIGNYVWTDLNGNGLNDEPSTAAISGVTVYLLDASNTIIDSTTTDLTGAYLFDSLASGTYYIQFPTSNSGNGLTTQTTTAQTDNNSDANTGTGISPAVVINTAGSGQDKDNTTIDAGYAPLGSIGNYVWTDLNGNGLNDEPSSAAISGVTVYLLDASNTIIDSTTTDLTGAYLFDSLASGTYYIQFPTSNSGNGLTTQTTTAQTDNNSDANTGTGISPAVVINTAGSGQDKDNTTIDAGYAPLGSIGNYVWTDLNGNGLNDEPLTAAISGVTVYLLDASNAIIDSTTTDLTGAYLFDSLASGTYYIQFPTSNSGNGLTTQTTTAQTDNNSDANTGTGISPAVVINTAGSGQDKDNTTIDAGYAPLGSIGNSVWTDLNGNGLNDEPLTAAISGVTVYLLDASNAIIDSTTTDLTGAYLFDSLSSGTYYIQFPTSNSGNGLTTQTTTAQTDNNSDANTGTGISPAVVINTAGTGQDLDNTTIDAGYAPLGSIGNYVWTDVNGNGLNDEPSTAAISGVKVYLLNASNTIIDSTTTDLTGAYLFDSLASGTYYIQFPTSNSGDILTTQTTTAQTDNNSDANMNTGISPAVVINASGNGQDKNNTTIDAGYHTPKACLGNYVWNDINHDGLQNNGEVGVAGITVSIYDATTQALLGSTITDAYGYYNFCPLAPGMYQLGFTLPANYQFTSLNSGSNDSTDSDVNPVTGVSTLYILSSGDSNMTADAGIYFVQPTTASVGNYVWFDNDHDGIQDSGENGISGVTVTLYNTSGDVVATTITDANGFYQFTDVTPGNYQVGFTTPVGLVFSPNSGTVNNPSNSDANPSTGMTAPFAVIAGDQITYVDAGLYTQPANNATLGDKVWYDEDQDGIQDSTETGVVGVTVTLYDATGTTAIATTTTDAFGDYVFNNLTAGQYVIGFSNLPTNYTLTSTSGADSTTNSDANPTTGKTNVINLSAGQYNMTYDAGIYSTIPANNNSLGNYVWNDVDKDGIQDATEQGVPGVTVTLYNASTNQVVSTTSTDALGTYRFANLPNGTYYVGFTNLPVGYVFSPTGQGNTATDNNADPSTGLTSSVTLSGNTHDFTIDAGINLGNQNIGLGTLGDIVWYDLDNNGLQDPGESGVASVSVTLYESDGTTIVSTTTTDALGNYIFTNLPSGNYVVGFSNLPAGFTISPKNADSQGINGEVNSDVNPGTMLTDIIALGQGEDKMSVDMGIVPPSGSASLGNLVWIDLNNDGLQTSGEPGVQGVGITLYDAADNVIATTTTDANGEYYFIGLVPDTYYVGFDNLPQGYSFTTKDANTTGNDGAINSDADSTTGLTTTVTLAIGDNNLNLDAGFVSTTVASVGDYVWYDLNRDGIQDANEPGLGGVLVTLLDNTNTPVASAITKPNGSYIFTNVTPGTYPMSFNNLPFGMEFTTQETNPTANTGSNVNPTTGITPSFTVTAGTHNPTIDAGLKTPFTGGLGNYVWNDLNSNGLQEPNEPGVPGVVVTLYDATGTTVLATAITDGNGGYSFTNLADGGYIVGFSNLPSNTLPTSNVGTIEDASNSDMLPSLMTNVAFVTNGNYNPNVDAGIVIVNTLPVHELTATSAVITNKTSCNVYWFTQQEMNTKNFIVERSTNGSDFSSVGTKLASTNTLGRKDYMFTDNINEVLNASMIYYRIKLYDIDNKVTISNIIIVRPTQSKSDVMVYPIPFTNEIKIQYPSDQSTVLTLNLVDMSGRVVTSMQQEISVGLNEIKLLTHQGLNAGSYSLQLFNSGTGIEHFIKVIKVK